MTATMVSGGTKALAKAGIWARILYLAVRTYGLRRAGGVLRRMVHDRALVQRWRTRKYATAGGRYFWNLYAPGWPSRAFDRYVEREFDRIAPFLNAAPALQTAVVAITKRCAYQCAHCCEWAALNAPEALDEADLRAIVERLQTRGIAQLFLSGGEPLRRFGELIQLIALAAADTDVWILTSGQGLNAERAHRLREAGLTGVSLSLDHWDAESHDRFRGVPGAYRAVESAAACAREAGLVVALSLCPTREFISADALERYATTARRLGAGFIQILEPKAIGRFSGADVALSAAQQQILEGFSDRLNVDADCLELPAVSYPDQSKRRVGCHGAGDRHLYIDTDGSVHPCPFCRTSAGHVLDGDFDARLAVLRAAGCHAPH